ncbi:MAG: hypothetical protein JWM82_1775 [Myxococcales bacterium]|nr:hypothetical protein [Myxococcales bacterium]
MAHPLLMSPLGLLATAALASGCFTSPINMGPQVFIAPPTEGVFRGQPALFTATPIDPDGEVPSVDWESDVGSCPDTATDPSRWPASAQSGPMYNVKGETTASQFCVRARARDSHGATAIVAETIKPGDHAPTAAITPVTPAPDPTKPHAGSFPVHTPFVFVENAKDVDPPDTDTLVFTWSLTIDGVASPASLACDGDDRHKEACFTATVPGTFDLQLTVSDGTQEAVAHYPFLVLPGTPPVAHLDVPPGTHELGKTIELSGMRSMGSDPALAAKFTITPMGGAPMDVAPCAGSTSNLDACFTPTAPGTYTAKLELTSDGGSASDSQQIVVMADRLPCIGVTDPTRKIEPDPILRTPPPMDTTTPYSFSIKTVDDDLDGGDDAKALNPSFFEWSVSVGGQPFTLLATGSVLSVPQNEFPNGQPVLLRLQLRDRNRDAGDAHFATCSAPECHTTETCFQRWTWTVTFQ